MKVIQDIPISPRELQSLDRRVRYEFEHLLKKSPPRREKIHRLVKILKEENPSSMKNDLRERVIMYYEVPYQFRTSGQFLRTFGIRPYPWLLEQFILSFANAQPSENQLSKMASNFRFIFKSALRPPQEIIDIDFLYLVVYRTANPHWQQKSAGLDLSDLVECWREISFRKWGEKYQNYFSQLRALIRALDGSSQSFFSDEDDRDKLDEIERKPNLTQTDLDWMKNILSSMERGEVPPRYPLLKGPRIPQTRTLEKIGRILSIMSKAGTASRIDPARLIETSKQICESCLGSYGQLDE